MPEFEGTQIFEGCFLTTLLVVARSVFTWQHVFAIRPAVAFVRPQKAYYCFVRYFIFLFLSLFSQISRAQPDTLLLTPDSLSDLKYTIPLTGRATVWHSETGDISIPDSASPFVNNQMIDFEPGWCWNLRFFVKNPSETDTAYAFLMYQNGSRAQLRIMGTWGEKTLKTGCYLNLNQRALKDFHLALPIDLPPGARAQAILSLDNNMDRKKQALSVAILPKAALNYYREQRQLTDKPFYNFYLFLLSSLFLMALFATSQYIAHGDKSYLYYALYALSLWVYYIRHFSTLLDTPDLLKYFAGYFHVVEPFLNTLNMLAYILFFFHFLKKDFQGTKVETWLGRTVWLMLLLLPVYLLLEVGWGTVVTFSVFNVVRLLLMGIFLAFSIRVFFLFKTSVLSRFILGGIALLLVPILLMAIANFFPTQKTLLWGGFLEKYTSLPFPNYSTRTGILLEMVVFLFGLTYKTRMERLESERIRQRNTELENARLALEEKITAQRTKRHEERNQWTTLLLHAEMEKQALLEKLNRTNGSPAQNGKPAAHPFFLELKKVIEANYANPDFGIEPLAEALHISRATLFRQLKELGADAPAEIIRDYRLQKAADLLLAHPELNVGQIADACGFEESSHFIKLFSKKYGKTPLQWRKNSASQPL